MAMVIKQYPEALITDDQAKSIQKAVLAGLSLRIATLKRKLSTLHVLQKLFESSRGEDFKTMSMGTNNP